MTVERHDLSAVLFADITGSTQLYVDAGDERARTIVAQTLEAWSELTTAGGGRVIQLRGDGLLATFPTVEAALATAVGMRDIAFEPALSMHAGLHVGSVLLDADQLYGDAANLAARMADIAKRFEIVLSDAAHAELDDAGRWPQLRLIRKVPVKGRREPIDIYLLPSNRQALTDYRPPRHTKTVHVGLTLRYARQAVTVDSQSGACVIGRDQDCHLKLDYGLVSRRHATIECVSGKFFLQDHSTNGTYVAEASQSTPTLVQREICQLRGSGVISLGIEPALNADRLIAYAIGA